MKRKCVVLCIALALAFMAASATSALALVPDGTQGWFWQMPQPAGGVDGLSALAFPDAGNIWTVGAGGLILHSTDGGVTWSAQPTGTDADLWSVSFPDDQHGCACGGSVSGPGGVIVATTDGGATWVDKTPSGLTESLTNASFVSATHGWIGTTGGEILKTTNGGADWTHEKVKSLYRNSPFGSYFAGYRTIDFVGASRGWAGGGDGQIWTTANGGKTWAPVFSGLTPDMVVTQVDFVDPVHGWVLAQSLETGMSKVIATRDGGLLWRTVATGDWTVGEIDATSASSVWLLDGGYSSFAAFNDYFGFFGGVGQVTVQHSSDGGLHWQSSSVGSPFAMGAIAARGNVVCAVGDGILTSSDAGKDWQSATSGQEYYFTAATALSAGDIWAVDASGALLHSEDGSHWVEQASPMRWATTAVWRQLPRCGARLDRGHATRVAKVPGVILHTSDGGATWGVAGLQPVGRTGRRRLRRRPQRLGDQRRQLRLRPRRALDRIEHTTDGGVHLGAAVRVRQCRPVRARLRRAPRPAG